eukprot:2301742-Amphidinium_carterae.5
MSPSRVGPHYNGGSYSQTTVIRYERFLGLSSENVLSYYYELAGPNAKPLKKVATPYILHTELCPQGVGAPSSSTRRRRQNLAPTRSKMPSQKIQIQTSYFLRQRGGQNHMKPEQLLKPLKLKHGQKAPNSPNGQELTS